MPEAASSSSHSGASHHAGRAVVVGHVPGLRHHFEDMEQQHEAGSLGMWAFLVTEIMFFGAVFAAYAIYRELYLPGFEGGSRLLDIKLGATNTAVLICSSLTMVMAVHSAQTGKRKLIVLFLILTMVLGAVFLGIKYVEWSTDWTKGLVPGLHWGPTEEIHGNPPLGSVEMFFCFYFIMTGLHAMHMIVGFGILTVMAIMAWGGRFSPEYNAPVEVSGLYWHFVDIIWIFLFPLLYLIGGRY